MDAKPRSDARIRAIKKYNDKLATEKTRLQIWLNPLERQQIQDAAAAAGLSVAAYVRKQCLPDQQSTTADDGGTK